MRIPVAREGAPFILASFFSAIIAFVAGAFLPGVFLILVTAFILAFFRDPERVIPQAPGAIVSPADGRVIKVERVTDSRLLGGEVMKISIFMSIFDVHVNRVPSSGRVESVSYNPGRFLVANRDKASLENEQNGLVVRTPGGRVYAFNQIAGLVARRIVCRVGPGDVLTRGDRFGMIRFGSRLDVYLPTECTPGVETGDRVRAGSSIIASWDVEVGDERR